MKSTPRMKPSKTLEVGARITVTMKTKIEAIAAARGECVSLIVREAIREYLALPSNAITHEPPTLQSTPR